MKRWWGRLEKRRRCDRVRRERDGDETGDKTGDKTGGPGDKTGDETAATASDKMAATSEVMYTEYGRRGVRI